jgi:putative peptide zinc metalloprotease protein
MGGANPPQPGAALERYYLTDALSLSRTDDPQVGRRYCIFIGRRVFHGSERLARLLECLAQESSLDAIVERLNQGDLTYSVEQVRSVIETQLIPAGLVSTDKQARPSASSHLPYVFFARSLAGPATVARACSPFTFLFAPRVLAVVLLACGGLLSWWMLAALEQVGGWRSAVSALEMTAGDFLLFYAMLFGAFAFHELGHAAASRYSGADPAEIGIGLYLVFPVLFCNVTEAWRLPRGSRMRVNLGGVYFQLIVTALAVPVQLATHSAVVAAFIGASLTALCVTLNPFFRFDGYWVYSDLFRLPNLRDQARAWGAHVLTRVAHTVTGRRDMAAPAGAGASMALRLYALASTVFFTVFTLFAARTAGRLVVSLPALLGAVRTQLEGTPTLEVLVRVSGSATMVLVYMVGALLSALVVLSTMGRGVRLVRVALATPRPSASNTQGVST